MVPFDLPPPPFWLPPKPAVIRPAEVSLLGPGAFRPMTRAERRAVIADLVRSKRLTRAEAKRAMLLVPVVGWGTESASAVGVEYVDKDGDSSNHSTYDFGTKSLGSAVDGWVLVNVVHAYSSGSPEHSGLTVGGSAATPLIAHTENFGTAPGGSAWYIIAVSAATTSANITATFDATTGLCGIMWYRLTGLTFPNGDLTAYDTDFDPQIGDASTSVDVASGGAVFGGIYYWRDADDYCQASAHTADLASESGRTVSATGGGYPPTFAGVTVDDNQIVQSSSTNVSARKVLATVSLR